MTRRQDNPILLWLQAKAVEEFGYYGEDYDEGQVDLLDSLLDVCRWLDAEEAWRKTQAGPGVAEAARLNASVQRWSGDH